MYKQSLLVPEIVVVIEELGPVLWEQGEILLQNSGEEPGSDQSS